MSRTRAAKNACDVLEDFIKRIETGALSWHDGPSTLPAARKYIRRSLRRERKELEKLLAKARELAIADYISACDGDD